MAVWLDDPIFRIRQTRHSGSLSELQMSRDGENYEFVGQFKDPRFAMLLMKAITEEALFGVNDGVAR